MAVILLAIFFWPLAWLPCLMPECYDKVGVGVGVCGGWVGEGGRGLAAGSTQGGALPLTAARAHVQTPPSPTPLPTLLPAPLLQFQRPVYG